jgi:phosphonate degradation associated HDIG domain protein
MKYTPEQTAEYLIGLYQKYGQEDYIGEPVSQIEHMIQCASIAEAEGYNEEVILAALFHDIGHFCEHLMEVKQMDGYGVVDHEKLGADFLRELHFSENIASLVQNHVQAKRYLTYAYPSYYENLSEASRHTLEFQGGMMSKGEAESFEADPLFETHIQLRRWDEMAKIENRSMPSLDHYGDMMIRHLNK